MSETKQNKYSHLTATERNYLSFPANYLLKHNLLTGKILDFGCGLGSDVKFLQEKGFNIVGYDPYYFPSYPTHKYQTIICFYVLNVLFKNEQSQVIMEISKLLEPGGNAYFAVRRDLKRQGFREHYIHKKPTYQCLVKLPFKSIYLDDNREIYEYIHFNYLNNSHKKCLFCNPYKKLNLITESELTYAIYDGYPLTKGHALIIPKRHIANYFEMSFAEQSSCWLMVNQVQKIIQQTYQADGFNVGFNVSQVAGQKIPHVTIHVIPRYKGDSQGKKTGIRGVV